MPKQREVLNKGRSGIRVLHCPNMVGGHPQGLSRAERKLGLESWAVSFYQSPLGYKTDEVLWTETNHPVLCEGKRWWLLWRALKDFDIIHFNFGQSLMPYQVDIHVNATNKYTSWVIQRYCQSPSWVRKAYRVYSRLFELRDLPLLKRAGKGIVVTYQGDDARQGDFCLKRFEIEPGYYSSESDWYKRNRIVRFARYADKIYALNPDLLYVLSTRAEFLPYSHVDLKEWALVDKGDVRVPMVIHAPIHHGIKGTHFILETISKLQQEGILFEFILVEGLTHAEARKLYEKADLLIDQLLLGWYGGIAVELMALGKPVICYIREDDLKFIPHPMKEEIPIINATPHSLYQVLKEWLTKRRHELREVGQRSRAFVENWHDPLKIAARLKLDYEAILVSKKRDPSS